MQGAGIEPLTVLRRNAIHNHVCRSDGYSIAVWTTIGAYSFGGVAVHHHQRLAGHHLGYRNFKFGNCPTRNCEGAALADQ